MSKKSVDDYLTEGMYGVRLPKEEERARFLGTLRERIVIALTIGQVMSDSGLGKLEEAMKLHPKARLIMNGHVGYRFLREEKALADQYNIPYTTVTDEERINQLVEAALAERDPAEFETNRTDDISVDVMDDPDWKVRYAALDQIIEPDLKHLPLLDRALDDAKSSVRRLATAYLGMIEEPEVLPLLYKALKDKAVNVRRTAGDCLSDLGFKEAIPAMIETLDDPSQIVRWRGAMFLYELGDETAIPALEAKINDPEFEVRMQVKLALERIQGGEEAKGSVWHQMTQAVSKKE